MAGAIIKLGGIAFKEKLVITKEISANNLFADISNI